MKRDDEDAVALSLEREVVWTTRHSAAEVISLLEPMVLEPRRERILAVLKRRLGCLTLVLDSPHDPHNGAAILRTSEALGLHRVHIVASSEPFMASARVSKGTHRWLRVNEHPSAADARRVLDEQGFELIATHPEGELAATELAEIPRLALVFGNELEGISAELKAGCVRSVRVPMRGFVESLNVSVAAGILLAHATAGRPGDLGPQEFELAYASSLFNSVTRAADVLAAREVQ